jgi:hypothetical protein
LKTNYVLIDYENVHVKSLALLRGDQFRVHVFLGKNNTKIDSELAIAMQKIGDRAEYVMLESSGRNALDFHIAYYLGFLVATDPTAYFHIISKDTGFDPLVEHLKTRKVFSARSASIEAMPYFDSAPVVTEAAHESPTLPAKHSKVAPPVKVNATSSDGKVSPTLEDQIQVVMKDLNNRKSARPAKMMTLLSTIHTKIGKDRPLAEAEAVRDLLVKRKHVSVNGLKVTYQLPTAG